MKRRNLLKYGLFGSLALVGGGVGLGLQSSKHYLYKGNLKVFTPDTLDVLAAVAEAIIPNNPPFPSALDLDVPEGVDALLANAHPAVQEEITLLLGLLENAAVNALLHFKPTPFSKMTLEERTRILAGWASSPLALQRKGYKALNGLCQSAYYAQAKVHNLLGYDGPPTHLTMLVNAAQRSDGEP